MLSFRRAKASFRESSIGVGVRHREPTIGKKMSYVILRFPDLYIFSTFIEKKT